MQVGLEALLPKRRRGVVERVAANLVVLLQPCSEERIGWDLSRIDVKSEVGKGSSFKVILPRIPPVKTAPPGL